MSTSALIFVLVLDAARNRIQRALDRRFSRSKSQLDLTLQQMSQAVSQLVDPPVLAGSLFGAADPAGDPALNTASLMNAYVLADRATWLAFKNRGDLAILVEGDKRLYNQYGVIFFRVSCAVEMEGIANLNARVTARRVSAPEAVGVEA